MMQKNFKDIFERVHEDDYSLVKLSKEIGKIYYCLHKYYPIIFSQVKDTAADFFNKLINKEDDYIL
jgi:hypothetical protein